MVDLNRPPGLVNIAPHGGAIVVDFEVEKARHGSINTELTSLGFVLGTPAYLARTQAVDEEIG